MRCMGAAIGRRVSLAAARQSELGATLKQGRQGQAGQGEETHSAQVAQQQPSADSLQTPIQAVMGLIKHGQGGGAPLMQIRPVLGQSR